MAHDKDLDVPPPLTKDNVVDAENFHTRNESASLEKGLDRFLRIFSTQKNEFQQYIQDENLNESSKNFVLVLRFLRNFKCHHHELYVKNPADQAVLRKEVMGLMASILQVIMNANHIPEEDQIWLREIYFGEEMRQILKEKELQNLRSDFQYRFPKLFINGKVLIRDDWFTNMSAKKTAIFSSSAIHPDILEFTSVCLVHIYEKDLAATYKSAHHERAVQKLKTSCDMLASDGQSKRRKVETHD